jgi:hypothetical protein
MTLPGVKGGNFRHATENALTGRMKKARLLLKYRNRAFIFFVTRLSGAFYHFF